MARNARYDVADRLLNVTNVVPLSKAHHTVERWHSLRKQISIFMIGIRVDFFFKKKKKIRLQCVRSVWRRALAVGQRGQRRRTNRYYTIASSSVGIL
jgi:hypothetical protein